MSAQVASRRNLRIWLAGPGAFATALIFAVSLGFGLPAFEHVDMRVTRPGAPPMIDTWSFFLTPAWAALFYEACLDRSLKRASIVMLAVVMLSVGFTVWHVKSAGSRGMNGHPAGAGLAPFVGGAQP